ncbi:MAG: hypothetical protein JW904_09365 [Spirochaetales bacterium]|nr:hypothetical protein [Spirochaetales bacterium]
MKTDQLLPVLKNNWMKPVFILAVSFFLFIAWAFMIGFISGWKGLAWLSWSYSFGVVIVILFNIAVIFFLVPFEGIKKHWVKVLVFLVCNSVLFAVYYDCAMFDISALFYWTGVTGFVSYHLLDFCGGLVCVILVPLIGSTVITVLLIRIMLVKISWFTILFIPMGFVGAWYLSWFCFSVIPYVNYHQELPDLVKAGYPVFWGPFFYLVALQLGKLFSHRRAA